MAYQTARKKIANKLAETLKEIDGSYPYNTNVFDNVGSRMVYLDEIEQYPKVCVVAGDESRQYLPDGFKWRFLILSVRAYVSNEEDAQEENEKRQEMRKQTIEETGHSMVEETMGPILSIMSEV